MSELMRAIQAIRDGLPVSEAEGLAIVAELARLRDENARLRAERAMFADLLAARSTKRSWEQFNERRAELIGRHDALSAEERVELDRMQAVCDLYLDLTSPLPVIEPITAAGLDSPPPAP
jgi:hypothetical protein